LILLDSNTVIHYLKGVEAVVVRLQAAPPRELAIPSVVAYEVEYGNRKTGSARRRTAITALLAVLTQAPFDHAAASESARIRVDLEARGLTIGPLDLLIAGTALSRGAILVTHNTREFRRIRNLRLVDWME
jgi:tRNA(fMet)-specific endonuclease VapC